MNIFHTCLDAGHNWSVETPVPYQGEKEPAEHWVNVSLCLRKGCTRLRAIYPDGTIYTYDASASHGPYWINVVRNRGFTPR